MVSEERRVTIWMSRVASSAVTARRRALWTPLWRTLCWSSLRRRAKS